MADYCGQQGVVQSTNAAGDPSVTFARAGALRERSWRLNFRALRIPASAHPAVPPAVAGLICMADHALERFATTNPSFSCDACSSVLPLGTWMMSCRQCNYDLCDRCTSGPAPPGVPWPPPQVRAEEVDTYEAGGNLTPADFPASVTFTRGGPQGQTRELGYEEVTLDLPSPLASYESGEVVVANHPGYSTNTFWEARVSAIRGGDTGRMQLAFFDGDECSWSSAAVLQISTVIPQVIPAVQRGSIYHLL